MKLGIIDWGIGGVGLLKKIRKDSSLDILYFSDTGFIPYGKVPTEELQERLLKVIDYLRVKECDFIAVGCNAASTVLPVDKNIFGVIEPAIALVAELKLQSIGIVGGKRTIESEIYKKVFEKIGMEVNQRIAQPLSARIEAGDLDSAEMENEIKEIFEPLKGEKNILLACTHYPVISDRIRKFLPEVNLIDPIGRMAEIILNDISDKEGHNAVKWMTSGNIYEMQDALKKVYGIEANLIERRIL